MNSAASTCGGFRGGDGVTIALISETFSISLEPSAKAFCRLGRELALTGSGSSHPDKIGKLVHEPNILGAPCFLVL